MVTISRSSFWGGSKNHLQIMVDAPRDVDIMRSEVYERMHPEAAEQNNYYAEPDPPKNIVNQNSVTLASMPDRHKRDNLYTHGTRMCCVQTRR